MISVHSNLFLRCSKESPFLGSFFFFDLGSFFSSQKSHKWTKLFSFVLYSLTFLQYPITQQSQPAVNRHDPFFTESGSPVLLLQRPWKPFRSSQNAGRRVLFPSFSNLSRVQNESQESFQVKITSRAISHQKKRKTNNQNFQKDQLHNSHISVATARLIAWCAAKFPRSRQGKPPKQPPQTTRRDLWRSFSAPQNFSQSVRESPRS